ncbi:MAG: M14 family zinc carboxypeptidase [Bacteriovoracaceae bacterium]
MIKPVAFLLFLTGATQASLVQEEVFIPQYDEQLIQIIQGQPELTLDHLSKDGFELYGPAGMKKWLEQAEIDYLEPSAVGPRHHKQKDLAKSGEGYPSFDELTSFLKNMAAKRPDIVKLVSLGKSVEGRDLWMMKISDNVQVDEVEPEFKYISSMHGDEITGRELMRFFIEDIVNNYGQDKRITRLVNNTELFIMPSMNPDGSHKRMRGNANWKDLNRNFPDWTSGDRNTGDSRQPETKAIMKFQAKRQIALSANFHGGAVVVNYPWDAAYERHPLDELIKGFSLRYAELNPEMKNSTSFEDGVTNGADWYKVAGGMQDWSYYWHNDLQVTIELSDRKWPRYSEIPGFYARNKDSLFLYPELIHQGAGFKLKNSESGRAKVVELQFNGKEKDRGTYGFRDGEFYKALEPGNYRFEVETDSIKKSFEARVEADKIYPNGNYSFL